MPPGSPPFAEIAHHQIRPHLVSSPLPSDQSHEIQILASPENLPRPTPEILIEQADHSKLVVPTYKGNHDLEAQKPAAGPDPSSFPGRPPGLHPLAIPPLTMSQKLYIIIPQMIGAALIDGAANFAIACAMYLNAKNVRIWILKNNTVAGDLAITIFIQGVATFCIASGMVHVDLRKNKIKAFPYPWPDTSWGTLQKRQSDPAKSKLAQLWVKFHNEQGLSRGLHFFSGSDVNDIFDGRLNRKQFFVRLAWSVWKGSVLSVIYFFIMWPISIAIISPIWAGDNLGNGNFTVPIIKGIYGAVYGLLMNPVCAMIAMGSEDSVRHHRSELQRQRFDHPEKQAMNTTAAERVSVVVERSANEFVEDSGRDDEFSGERRDGLAPRRVQGLRRSLDGHNLSLMPFYADEEDPNSYRRNEAIWLNGTLLERRSDVHRRRSVDVPRRPRYDRHSSLQSHALVSRSASAGHARYAQYRTRRVQSNREGGPERSRADQSNAIDSNRGPSLYSAQEQLSESPASIAPSLQLSPMPRLTESGTILE